jgi:diguanylate cyclase (GGDEF)-like protein
MRVKKTIKKILVLEDEPKFIERFKVALKNKSIEVCQTHDLEEARRFLKDEHCGLVVHSVHRNMTCKTACCELTKEFPNTPTLHIASDEGLKAHPIPKGSHHGFFRYLGSEKQFMRKVKTLWRTGRMKSKMINMSRVLKNQRQLDKALDSQEPEKLIAQFMAFLHEKLETKNVLWLVDGDLNYYLSHHWKVKSLDPAVKSISFGNRSVAYNSLKPVEISEVLESINSLLPGGIVKNYSPVEVRAGSPHFDSAILVALQANDKFYGHLVLLDPQAMPHKDVFHYWVERLTVAYKHSLAFLEAKSLCYVDDVTEFYNQRYLGMALDTEISRGNRNKSPFSVLFIDIDHFKRVNDTKGHLVGSRVLTQLSRILKRNIRTVDYGFRYGGDEFILLLVNTAADNARFVAERIRAEVERTVFNVDSVELRITLSIGVASYPEHATSKEEIVDMADKAMYDGKAKSRNIVFVAS